MATKALTNISPLFPNIAAILLAGGASKRMGGKNKAFIKIAGKTIIDREIEVLEQLFERIIIVSNSFDQYAFLKKPIFADIKPGYGSLGGILTGLKSCSREFGFVLACDMPFLNKEIVSYMCCRASGHDITIPRIGRYLEPLHAVYSSQCIPHIEKLMQRGELKVANFFKEVDMLEIDERELMEMDPCLQFRINVNTPADLNVAIRMAIKNGSDS
ncbi:MAG: molybdenum cofactor guanylyltransferase [Deltaproteobacteria bacterium]|nr:molybdenum cofactor guanylyltransferase [Deltaproteobacteria bacterium]